jgi:hypothetical protein
MSSKILTSDQLTDVLNILTDKIQTEIFQANAVGNVYEVFKRLGYEYLIIDSVPSYSYVDVRHSKILVIAYHFDQDNLSMAAKKIGIDPSKIDFIEYKSNFDFGKLRYSSKYSDVLVGPIPHKGVNIGDASSFLAACEKAPGEYPKTQRLEDSNGNLKVTKTSFVERLKSTKYFQEVI